jgi:hypothetical protein
METFGHMLVIASLLIVPSAARPSPTDVTAPLDMSTGMVTGKRMHKTFTITNQWSSRDAAVADCTALHGTVSTSSSGKLVCTDDVNGNGMTDVCARASGMSAMCKP